MQWLFNHPGTGRAKGIARGPLHSKETFKANWVGAWVNQRELDNKRAPRATSWRYLEQCGA